MLKDYLTYITESEKEDIIVDVDGFNISIIERLKQGLAFVVKKKKIKNFRIKSIHGYNNKKIFTRNGVYYDTELEIILSNKDIIIGTFNSKINNIKIKINDEMVYDMINSSFDNELLVDKIIDVYIKYLKNKKYILK